MNILYCSVLLSNFLKENFILNFFFMTIIFLSWFQTRTLQTTRLDGLHLTSNDFFSCFCRSCRLQWLKESIRKYQWMISIMTFRVLDHTRSAWECKGNSTLREVWPASVARYAVAKIGTWRKKKWDNGF